MFSKVSFSGSNPTPKTSLLDMKLHIKNIREKVEADKIDDALALAVKFCNDSGKPSQDFVLQLFNRLYNDEGDATKKDCYFKFNQQLFQQFSASYFSVGATTHPIAEPKLFHDVQAVSTSHKDDSDLAAADFDTKPLFTRRFRQTTEKDALRSPTSPLTDIGKSVVQKVAINMCKIRFETETLGTGILLNKEYILVPRHCVEGRLVGKLKFESSHGLINCISVVEEDSELDYAILKISVLSHEFPQLRFASEIPEDTLLLHHPLGKDLMVSGHSKTPENPEQARVDGVVSVSHDTDNESSGGAYINSKEELVAIHLGVDIYSNDDSEQYSHSASIGAGAAERYVLPVNEIITKIPNGIVASLVNGQGLKERVNTTYLEPVDRPDSWEREGKKSQEILTNKLRNLLIAQKKTFAAVGIKLVGKAGKEIVSFGDPATLNILQTEYKAEFQLIRKSRST